MNIFKMTKEELEQLSYTDIAFEILKKGKKQMKTIDLFKKVCDLLEISEEVMMEKIGDFFTTDKRFYSLPSGLWDLKEKHSHKIKINEDDEDIDSLDLEDDDEDEIRDEETEDDYSDEATDDYEEDDLENLVVISNDDDEDAE